MGPCIVSTFLLIYSQRDATLHSLFISGKHCQKAVQAATHFRITNLKTQMQQKIHQKQDKDENKNGQHLHIIAHKLENSPISSNIPT